MRQLMQIRHVRPAQDRPDRLLVRKAPEPVLPASAAECVQALEALCAGGGGPRWAVTGWCVDLAGPMRSMPRAQDDGDGSRQALEELLDRLRPGQARTEWPSWMQGSTDPVMLGVGVAAGRPDKKVVVDIPAAAAGLVVTSAAAWSGWRTRRGAEIRCTAMPGCSRCGSWSAGAGKGARWPPSACWRGGRQGRAARSAGAGRGSGDCRRCGPQRAGRPCRN